MKKTFSVLIAAHKYFIDIYPEDEELMRRAVKKINDQMEALGKTYDVTTFDRLALASLLISIENEENKEKQKYSTERQELDQLAESVKRALMDDAI